MTGNNSGWKKPDTYIRGLNRIRHCPCGGTHYIETPHSKLNSLLQINFIFGKFVSISLLNEKTYQTLPILYLFINTLTNIIYSHPQRRCACYYVIMHETSLHYKALQHEMYRCLSLCTTDEWIWAASQAAEWNSVDGCLVLKLIQADTSERG